MSENASTTKELASGAKLKINLAPFNTSKKLYQAILGEVKGAQMDPNQEIDANFFKDIFCILQDSGRVEAALWDCLGRCTYNDSKITEELLEAESVREDYLEICMEVTRRNVSPFTKNLFARYKGVLSQLVNIQKSDTEKTETT